jgi:hypothetical protein
LQRGMPSRRRARRPRRSAFPRARRGGALPLGLGREAGVGPVAVRDGVVPGDVHHRVVRAVADVRAGAFGALPGGVGDGDPPGGFGDGVGGGLPGRFGELEVEDEGRAGALGFGDVVGGADEGGEVGIGDGGGGDAEGGEVDGTDGPLGVAGDSVGRIAAHREGGGGNVTPVIRWELGSRSFDSRRP